MHLNPHNQVSFLTWNNIKVIILYRIIYYHNKFYRTVMIKCIEDIFEIFVDESGMGC